MKYNKRSDLSLSVRSQLVRGPLSVRSQLVRGPLSVRSQLVRGPLSGLLGFWRAYSLRDLGSVRRFSWPTLTHFGMIFLAFAVCVCSSCL
jgi:hypothetical protein